MYPLYTRYTFGNVHQHGIYILLSLRSCPLFCHQPQNRGIEAVPALLKQFESSGVTVRRIDPTPMTEQERFHEHSRACTPAVCKRYEVKRMFGTNRQSALFFGLQVPALIVKQPDDPYGDTYPHRERPNTIVTICDFLSKALAILHQR